VNVVARNNVVLSGQPDGPAVVFAHGFGCDRNMWRYVAPEFEADHKVVLFDHVVAGHSDASAYDREKYGSLRGYADDVLEILDALGLSRVVFVGHSVSAMITTSAGRPRWPRSSWAIPTGPSWAPS
jgi:sigma-B regulation protein RsbQ